MRHAFTFVSASVGVIPVGSGGLVVSGGGLVVSGFALPPRRASRGRTAVPGERRGAEVRALDDVLDDGRAAVRRRCPL